MPPSRKRSSHSGIRTRLGSNSDGWLFWVAVATLWIFLLLGGGPIKAGAGATTMLVVGAICLLAFGTNGGLRRLAALPTLELLLLAAIVALPLVQLIPLPPSVWSSLPNRETENQILSLAGQSSAWLPLTIDKSATLSTLAMTLALGGAFLAGLTLPQSALRRLIIGIVVFVMLSLLVGAIQLSSAGKLLAFYQTSHKGLLLGFFANRNHEALLIAISILCAGYLFGASRVAARQRLTIFGLYAFVAFAAALGTASRMGLALCVLAAFAAPFLFLGVTIARKRYLFGVGAAVAVVLAGLAALSGRAGSALSRYGDVSGDYRWTIWERSVRIMTDTFPYGSGLGSFADIYKKYEQVEWLLPNYVNDAHNDYIQFAIEGGVLGVGVLLLLLLVLGRAAWRSRGAAESHRRDVPAELARLGVGIILLILIHSTVDYPLRRPALGVTFAFALALALRHGLSTAAVRRQAVDPAPE